nr:glucose-6-phosphate/phosphate translocator 2, chloroplastic-like [Ipomoea batatas]
MACSIKHSPFSIKPCGLINIPRKGLDSDLGITRFLSLPRISKTKILSSDVSTQTQRPLYIASVSKFGLLPSRTQTQKPLTQCGAYEADRSAAADLNIEATKSEAAQKLKIGIYFAMWWALNVVFNIYNKKVLNAYPYPWLTSTLSLAAGSLIMLLSWATRIAEAPKTDLEFWKTLFPVAVAHTIGHVAATVSMSKVAVSFTHIIKSGEPAFSVLVSRFLLGETFPIPVYLSLLPIIGGCALAAVTELNFNMTGITTSLVYGGYDIEFGVCVSKYILEERDDRQVCQWDELLRVLVNIVSIDSHALRPIAMEGPQMWAAGWQTALSEIGPNFVWWVAAQSIFYHLYNQVSYMSLDEISPLTFSIGNTMKRISVIVSSIIIFHTPVQPVNALGAAIAILGTFLYSQIGYLFSVCFLVSASFHSSEKWKCFLQ